MAGMTSEGHREETGVMKVIVFAVVYYRWPSTCGVLRLSADVARGPASATGGFGCQSTAASMSFAHTLHTPPFLCYCSRADVISECLWKLGDVSA